jgi:predicted DsbA family dithiol-disulfide isomerase
MYQRIEAECEAVGLPFRRPERIPNTRRALATAEHVRRTAPGAFDALDRSLFDAHFVHRIDIGDPDVLDQLVSEAGADAVAVRAAVDEGQAHAAVNESMERARELDVTGTPSWLLDQTLLLPGVLPRELFERAVTRLRNRCARSGPGSGATSAPAGGPGSPSPCSSGCSAAWSWPPPSAPTAPTRRTRGSSERRVCTTSS